MNNILSIDGFKAVISFDPENEMFRGEFIDLNGRADFYASDVSALKQEANTSLRIFLELIAHSARAQPFFIQRK